MADIRTILGKVDLRRLVNRFGREVDLVGQVEAYRRIPPPVIADLADFCGAVDPPPRNGDLYQLGMQAGRREVWHRIQQHQSLTAAEIFALLKGEPFAKAEEWYRGRVV